VRKAIRAFGWHPIGHAGYAELLRHSMAGRMLDHDLISSAGERAPIAVSFPHKV
jgi:hypothetical protein